MQVKLNGTGTMQGRAKLVGTLQFGGFRVANAPDITGMVTVSNAKGTIKLQVAGNGGHSQLPRNQFTVNVGIVKATGVYAKAQGVGHLTLSFGANTLRGKTTAAGPATFHLDLIAPVR